MMTIYTEFHGGHVAIIGGDTTGFVCLHCEGGVSWVSSLSLCFALSLSSLLFRFGPILLHCISFDIPAGFQGWVLDIVFGWTSLLCFLLCFSVFLFFCFSFLFFLFSLGLYGVGVGFRGCKKTRTKRDSER